MTAAKRVQVERLTWDAVAGAFVATGDVTEVDAGKLDQFTNTHRTVRGLYLKGPIPWDWVTAAAALPGKALIVGLCLWRLAGATRNKAVNLGNADLAPFGVDRAVKSRALAALERAGLVTVARQPNRFPVVTLLTLSTPVGRREGRAKITEVPN
jgi:hypothetical protein